MQMPVVVFCPAHGLETAWHRAAIYENAARTISLAATRGTCGNEQHALTLLTFFFMPVGYQPYVTKVDVTLPGTNIFIEDVL